MATKKPLTVPKSGTPVATSPAPAVTTDKTPMEKMLHREVKNERTTICVNPELYKEFKKYALDHDTTVTALLNKFMSETVGK